MQERGRKRGVGGAKGKFVHKFPTHDQAVVLNAYENHKYAAAISAITRDDCAKFLKKHPTITQQSSTSPQFSFKEIEGDLFTAKNDSLGHCVSEDLSMSKGIATLFVSNFGRVDELRAQKVKAGGVAYIKTGDRFVFYLITKRKYWHIPTYEELWGSLQAMAAVCATEKVQRLSLPVIACGLDRLDWKVVREMIKRALESLPISVTIYTWK
eukprot:TRINITY_DN14594_c0_g1_i1.p1 TRINITY_DN14594_c0_g1~~TRINITY_DN14594_c0_g1_i1.p1  ORF type:complete len:211 (-),score=38.56 TRINITY_DN14594_c0_g1_i1:529-1161(-)